LTDRDRAHDQAGICILHEAGGAVFGSKTSSLSGDVDADLIGKLRGAFTALSGTGSKIAADMLAGRKYLLMRGMAPAEVSIMSCVQD
jgi:myo-inositol-1(or 4)-monophosphatase